MVSAHKYLCNKVEGNMVQKKGFIYRHFYKEDITSISGGLKKASKEMGDM